MGRCWKGWLGPESRWSPGGPHWISEVLQFPISWARNYKTRIVLQISAGIKKIKTNPKNPPVPRVFAFSLLLLITFLFAQIHSLILVQLQEPWWGKWGRKERKQKWDFNEGKWSISNLKTSKTLSWLLKIETWDRSGCKHNIPIATRPRITA